jgi:two-component system, sensor histidine kinase and response regulator
MRRGGDQRAGKLEVPRTGRLTARIRSELPRGGTLPDDVWRDRHRAVLTLLWLHLPVLYLFAVARGNSWRHSLLEAGAVAIPATLAQLSRRRRLESTVLASLGLMTASAVLVHLSGGVIEAHFHFFVMVGVVVLYQDWRPFLIAITFVVLHHGVIGVLSPEDVYNHRGAWEHPWTWAAVHGLFIVGMSAAGIANWKLNERSQTQLTRLASIVESSDNAIYGWTTEGVITSWNEGAARLYGYPYEEIAGRPLTVLVPPDRMAEAEAELARVRRGDRVEPFESERLVKGGGVVEVSITTFAVRTANGEVVGGASIARDITERKRAERELQHTLSLLSATLESTADGILVVEPSGAISSYNRKFAEMWRLPDSVLASGNDRDAIGFVMDQLEDPDAFLSKVEQLYHRPEAESHDTLHFKDGREFERSSKPQRVGGAIAGRVWNFHDVTERKRLEAQLAEARDKALETSRLKSEFLATMSHEIRTPMNGVIGLTGLLLDTSLTEGQRQYADGVRASGEALLGIINDILDFSKIEAGKLELEMVDFELAQALEEVAILAAEPARARGLELVTYCLPDVSKVVRGDVGRLRQILLNLVSNAVKFTTDGEVVVRASLLSQVSPDQVMVHLEVTDTGIGIDPETTERLFEPFSQADASTTRRYGGTGLGLAICRRLAEAMGGTIGVRSQLGQGSTFWLDLPFGRVEQSVRDADSALPEHPLDGLHVLVVDDNQTNRLVLASQLLAWNIAADLAPDAYVALGHLHHAAATSHPYDVALVDMAMPGMDGLELATTISADPALSSVRLLLLSSMPVEAEEAAHAGFLVRLTKPARLSQLYDALVRAVSPTARETAGMGDEPPPPAPPPVAGSKGRLLIVEDNAINQVVAKGLAANLGYGSDVAGNGLEALEALERRTYDAVLMDCQMPEMDGYETTVEIRRRGVGATPVPIIAMTAGALVEDRERCLAAGMDDYVPKPVKRAELERALGRWPSKGAGAGAGPATANAADPAD